MKIYPPPEGITEEQLKNGQWQVYADVECVDCRKVHALTNTNGGKCTKCGGECR